MQGEQVYFASQNSYGHPILPVPRVLVLAPAVALALVHVTSGLEGMQVGENQAGLILT